MVHLFVKICPLLVVGVAELAVELLLLPVLLWVGEVGLEVPLAMELLQVPVLLAVALPVPVLLTVGHWAG